MPFIQFTDTALIELIFSQHNETVENTVYFRGSSSFDAGDLQDLAEAAETWWVNEMAPQVSNTVTLVTVRARAMHTQFGAVIDYTPDPQPIGELTSPALPNNVTLAIKFGSGLAGRRTRGRNFFVGLTEAQVAGNEVISAEAGAIVTAYQNLNTSIQGTLPSVVHVVASRAGLEAPSFTGFTYPVIAYSTDGFVDSQRRRLAGRGG